MLVTPAGMLSDVSPVNQNTVRPSVVTLSGMVKDVSFLQSWKAALPILATVGVPSKVNVSSAEQPEKALAPMLVTVAGTVKAVSAEQELKARVPIVFSAVVPANVTEVNLLLWNAPLPIEVTLAGMVMLVIFA